MKFQKKIYLSRAQTRVMAMEHPIGDPTGGPAYGERNDPVSAIVAVATMAATAEAAFVAGSVAAGLMFAGAAINLVGNVSGNKGMMQVGSLIGLAGGVTGLYNMATATSSVSTEALNAANESGDAIGALNESQGWTSTGADAGAVSTSEAIVGSANPNTVVNDASMLDSSSAVTAPNTSTAGLVADNSTALADKGVVTYDMNSPNPNGIGASVSAGANAPSGYDALGAAGSPNAYAGQQTTSIFGNGANNLANPADKGFSFGMPDWSKMTATDKLLAAKLGSDVVGGVMSYVAPSEKDEAQTDYAQAAARNADANAEASKVAAAKTQQEMDLQKQRIANLNANMQMGLGITTNPNALRIAPPVPGLIQNQMRVA